MSKILIIDDDPLLIRMYQKKFENDGFVVQTADDGIIALSMVSEFKPDLVLLDVMMPKVNGLSLLSKIKEMPSSKNTPVIILSNVGGSDDVVSRAIELGAVCYLIKAENRPSMIVAKVKEIIAGYVHDIPQVKS